MPRKKKSKEEAVEVQYFENVPRIKRDPDGSWYGQPKTYKIVTRQKLFRRV